jgi:transcription-repair coupling factor (superfamily II helicase)
MDLCEFPLMGDVSKSTTMYNRDMSLDFLRETEEFKELLKSIKDSEGKISISGLVPPAKAFFLSTLVRESEKPVVFIRPSAAPLSGFEEQCRFFFSQWIPDSYIRCLPSLAENPYQEIFPSLETISSRMRLFYDLLHSPPALVITNLFGLLKPFPSPQDLKKSFINLEKGEKFGRDRILTALEKFGYSQEDLVNSHGEYAWRGGIVDVFSPWQSYPFRIEFSGDEVVSLREFELPSQRSMRRIDRLIIPSLREFPVSDKIFQEWEEEARQRAKVSFHQDIAEKGAFLKGGDIFPSFVFLSLLSRQHFVPYSHYLKNGLFVIDEPEEVERDRNQTLKDLKDQHEELSAQHRLSLPPDEIFDGQLWDKIKHRAVTLTGLPMQEEENTFHFSFQSVPRFENKIPFFLKYLKKMQRERERCFIYFVNEGKRKKMSRLLSQSQIPYQESPSPSVSCGTETAELLLGNLERGFSYPRNKLMFISEKDIFTEEKVLVSRAPVRTFISHFQDLKADDFVVHTDYGIGIFRGLVKISVDEKKREFIEIHYRDEDKLFVPVEDLNLVQKYTTIQTSLPILNKLGTATWERTKARTKKAIEDLAKELLQLYAQRKSIKGHGYSLGGMWQTDFEKTFEYEETGDQLRTLKEIYSDMEESSPMDRLLCGDVGYGKTEVAIRASFKAVMDGKQVAFLCPTTVLASQHLKTFQNRMVLFPVRVEGLTRFQTKIQQKKILAGLKKGLVDIVIGTHRLLSEDVQFRDLGLLVIDEEQRFGVNHKEKIKHMKSNVDVLAMTATPIPRTLNMSLSGLRDISLIETPPKDRLAIHTAVTPFSRKLVTSAVEKELAREGQVYFIHNRVEDIDTIAQMIEKWAPQAKVAVVHGQMSGSTLEERMIDFIHQKYNVLVSTTIIENGIDIPLVNTLIVNRADRFGLAQLYQLRGRVGRSSRQAMAYFLVPPYSDLTRLAKERLKALKEFSELGSGFRLAAKDLEIRGAGNFLGSQQHGYMEALGFDYYMHLLDQTIRELKGEQQEEVKSEINLRVDIRIPEKYLPQINLRLNLYKRISSVDKLQEIEEIKEAIEDRYGNLPASVENLLLYGVVKYLAQKTGIQSIGRVGRKIVIKFIPRSPTDLERLKGLLGKHSGTLTPQGVMTLGLSSEGDKEILDETIIILKELAGI